MSEKYKTYGVGKTPRTLSCNWCGGTLLQFASEDQRIADQIKVTWRCASCGRYDYTFVDLWDDPALKVKYDRDECS